jgi:hypothetical protein
MNIQLKQKNRKNWFKPWNYWLLFEGGAWFDPQPGHHIFRMFFFRGIPQPLQEHAVTLSRLGHDLFLLNTFQFMIHLLLSQSVVYSLATDSVVW